MTGKALKPLTPKQARFIEEYLVDLNATQAATRAGYSKRSAAETGWENLRKPHIAAALERAMTARSIRTGISADVVVEQLRRLAFAELRNAATWDTDSVELVDSESLPVAEAAAVRSIKMGLHGPELKMSDPVPALRLLGEHTGAFRAEGQLQQMVQVNIVVDDKREKLP